MTMNRCLTAVVLLLALSMGRNLLLPLKGTPFWQGTDTGYASARVDSDLVEGGRMDVGGFQYGVGVRVRF